MLFNRMRLGMKACAFQKPGRIVPLLRPSLPILPPLSVGRWLMASSVLVFGIIVVGGVTRLTESGLSITEWRPITGILPPLSHEEWATEFQKYRATPEFKLYHPTSCLLPDSF